MRAAQMDWNICQIPLITALDQIRLNPGEFAFT
jgi:hypothetical protein